jgi:phosphomannomutase
MKNLLHPEIIKSYDVRGVWGKTLVAEDIQKIAACFASEVAQQSEKHHPSEDHKQYICIGRDGRHSSIFIHDLLCDVFSQNGIEVIDLGIVPTPMLYFAMYRGIWIDPTHKIDLTCGFMITGSHNPPEYNGLKIMLQQQCLNGQSICTKLTKYSEQLKRDGLRSLQQNDKIGEDSKGNIIECNIGDDYSNTLLVASKLKIESSIENSLLSNTPKQKTLIPTKHQKHNIKKYTKIVWDPGNGAVVKILPQLLKALGNNPIAPYKDRNIEYKHIVIHSELDSHFSERSPNPSIENLNKLIETIHTNECDFGVAFDGDGDRIVLVLPNGRVLHGDELLFLLAQDLMTRHKSPKIIVDIKIRESILTELLKDGACQIIISPTGHSLIKQKIFEESALLAGEMSGHIFCAENYYGFDDPLFAMCKILAIHAKDPHFICNALGSLKPSFFYEKKLFCLPQTSKKIISYIKATLASEGLLYNDIDGVRYTESGNFWLIRSSNTEDLLVILIEAVTKEALYKIWSMLYRLLEGAMFLICDNERNDCLQQLRNIHKEFGLEVAHESVE